MGEIAFFDFIDDLVVCQEDQPVPGGDGLDAQQTAGGTSVFTLS